LKVAVTETVAAVTVARMAATVELLEEAVGATVARMVARMAE